MALVIAIGVMVAGVLISIWMARRETAPLLTITGAAEALEEDRFNPEELDAVSQRNDELGRLASVFQNMAREVLARKDHLDRLVRERTEDLQTKNRMLESLSTKLSKYLAPQVYSSIFAGEQNVELASKRKKLTVFFSDIVGFTETTDNLEAEELSNLLNHYLTEMSKIALEYGATIDKYIGDAILLFFGDPESKGAKEDAKSCVMMAIAMQRRMRELEHEWRDRGLERPFRVRIGIATGFCTVGNFGSQDRMDYTIIGNQVNLAARLESSAEPGTILIANETHSLAKDVILAEEQPPLTVKGFDKPIHCYKVEGILDDLAGEGKVIHKERDGVRVLVDLTKQDKSVAIRTIREVLSQLED
jgi:class 3 adenylate cyclase